MAYRLPELVPSLTLEGAVSLAEGVTGDEKNIDLAATYSVGALQLGAGYEQADAATTDKHQFALRVLHGRRVRLRRLRAARRERLRHRHAYQPAPVGHVHAGRDGVPPEPRLGRQDGGHRRQQREAVHAGVNHNLSKRTKVYAFFTKLDDGAAGLYKGDFKSTTFGLRHNF